MMDLLDSPKSTVADCMYIIFQNFLRNFEEPGKRHVLPIVQRRTLRKTQRNTLESRTTMKQELDLVLRFAHPFLHEI